MHRSFPTLCLALTALASLAACSESTESRDPVSVSNYPLTENDAARPGPKPPEEAFTACKGLIEKAACKVVFDGKDIAGTCRNGTGSLACAPNGPAPHMGGHRGPPPEALEACKSLTEGSSCALVFPAKNLAGTCRKGPDASAVLACAPRDFHPPPRGTSWRSA